MEKETIKDQLRHCPLRVRMNDGREYIAEKPEFITVGDYTASVLLKRDGAMRHSLLSLVNITALEPMSETAEG